MTAPMRAERPARGQAVPAVPAVPAATGQAFELPDGTTVNRAPRDMPSGEIRATYRLAWELACFRPGAALAQALANWLCAAQCELEKRGEWQPEALPPQSLRHAPPADAAGDPNPPLADAGGGPNPPLADAGGGPNPPLADAAGGPNPSPTDAAGDPNPPLTDAAGDPAGAGDDLELAADER